MSQENVLKKVLKKDGFYKRAKGYIQLLIDQGYKEIEVMLVEYKMILRKHSEKPLSPRSNYMKRLEIIRKTISEMIENEFAVAL